MQHDNNSRQIDWTPIRKIEKEVYKGRKTVWFLIRETEGKALIESADGKDLRWIFSSQIKH